MCGLWGMAGPGITLADIDIFIDMGIASQVRGKDAAGIFQTKSTNSARSYIEDGYKTVGTFMELLDDIDVAKKVHPNLLETVNVDVIMGHVRARTRGRNVYDNAHPFYTKTLVGMHNGTLNDVQYQHAVKTDSEMMFQDMEFRGIVPTLQNMNKNSAYAVSIFERESKTLIFATNGKRPLWFCNLKERGVIFWASEAAILRFALDRRGIPYYKPYPMPVNLVARLTPTKITSKDSTVAWTKIAEIVEKEEKPKGVMDVAIQAMLNSEAAPLQQLPMLAPPAGKASSNQPPLIVKKEEVKTNNVLAFPRSDAPMLTIPKGFVVVNKKDRTPLKDFYTLKCKCGKSALNFFQAKLCRRGEIGSPKYDPSTDKFECKDCKTIEKKANNAD